MGGFSFWFRETYRLRQKHFICGDRLGHPSVLFMRSAEALRPKSGLKRQTTKTERKPIMPSRTLSCWTIQKNGVSHWATNFHSLSQLHKTFCKSVPIRHELRQRDHDIGLKEQKKLSFEILQLWRSLIFSITGQPYRRLDQNTLLVVSFSIHIACCQNSWVDDH